MTEQMTDATTPKPAAQEKSAVKVAGVEELFAGPAPRRYKTVRLPISGHTVRIQSLNDLELSNYQAAIFARRGTGVLTERLKDAARRLIVLCLVDAAGNRILNDSHIARLATEWDGADVQFLQEQISTHVGIRTEDIAELAGQAKN